MRLFCLTLLFVLLVPGAAAFAANGQESIFEDEAELLERGPEAQARALDDIASLGADTIRSNVIWSRYAPGGKKRRKGFDASNPAAYRADKWDRLDDLVRGAQIRGLGLLFSPTAPMPVWASQCPQGAQRRRVCKPKPSEFGKFVQALGTRYSGAYADENQGGGTLPRVGRWSIWNEPNQPGWLTPQYTRKGGRAFPYAAHRYRELVRSAVAGLRRAGHGSDQILLGETAPIGRTSGSLANRPITPVDFIKALLCLGSRSGPCRGFRRLPVTGFAHHPYTRGGSQPPRARVLPGEITISTAGRLKSLLSRGGRSGRIPRNLPIYYTEFGYQTNPPDRLFGVTLQQQSQYLNESDWIAFRDKRVKSMSQYLLVDAENPASFQTGLRFFDGSAKPGYDAYRLPIWVSKSGSNVRVYGQVRPAPDDARELVDVQLQAPDGGRYDTVQTVDVGSHKGHFVATIPAQPGTWRLRWSPSSGGPTLVSREATAARR